MSTEQEISRLTLRHRVLDPWDCVYSSDVRPVIDGRDVLADLQATGYVSEAREWTGPYATWPLAVGTEERRVRLSADNCGGGCCGDVSATLRREGDRIVWTDWENTTGGPPPPGDVHFDAAQYERELVRAANDHGWEERADTVARLLEQRLRDSGWFERWGYSVGRLAPRRDSAGQLLPDAWPRLPEGVDVWINGPEGRHDQSDDCHYELTMTPDESAREAARRFAADLLAHHPKEAEELFGSACDEDD